MEKETPTKSLFNAGIAKLERIHLLKINMHDSRLARDWHTFSETMRCIRAEIDEFLEPDERTTADGWEIKINNELNTINRIMKNRGMLDYSSYKSLSDYCIFLAHMEHKYGLSMPRKTEDDWLRGI